MDGQDFVQDGPKYNMKLMNDERWSKFSSIVEKMIINSSFLNRQESYEKNFNTLNKMWSTLKNIMTEAANQSIPKLRQKKKQQLIKASVATNFKIAKSINKIYKFIKGERAKSIKSLKNNELISREKRKLSFLNYSVNKIFDKNMRREELLEALKAESNTHQNIARAEKKRDSLQRIQKAIERRWEDLKDNPKRMINSVLDRPRKSIVMDRLIEETSDGNTHIVTEGETIKTIVKDHFHDWTRKRDTNRILLAKWKKFYTPISSVNHEWYHELGREVDIEELRETISTLPNKKAPGQSNLQYEWFKHLPTVGIEVLRKIINDAIFLNNIPTEWKRGFIYPIPKTADWGNNLGITRPITLLEAGRKIFMKLMNNKLSHIFSAKEILSKHNYAGLPGDDTQGPIHIINNIMEDARANKRELWLMFQDMSKAFDSVNSDCLVLALRRIKTPEWFIHLMKNLLNNRENIVLTIHGNTDSYKVEDGLDQGDIISPLMWRIFYDPLISRIAKSGLGYTMNECWTNDLCLKTQANINLEVAVAAYVDDTNWFAPDRSSME